MRLMVKIKASIIFVAKGGKKDKDIEIRIQKIAPQYVEFRLGFAMPFTDDGVKYMLKTIPEYADWMGDIKRHVNSLEGNKEMVLNKLQGQYHKLVDVTASDCKIKLDTKVSHYINYEQRMHDDKDYSTSAMQYDDVEDNILV